MPTFITSVSVSYEKNSDWLYFEARYVNRKDIKWEDIPMEVKTAAIHGHYQLASALFYIRPSKKPDIYKFDPFAYLEHYDSRARFEREILASIDDMRTPFLRYGSSFVEAITSLVYTTFIKEPYSFWRIANYKAEMKIEPIESNGSTMRFTFKIIYTY